MDATALDDSTGALGPDGRKVGEGVPVEDDHVARPCRRIQPERRRFHPRPPQPVDLLEYVPPFQATSSETGKQNIVP